MSEPVLHRGGASLAAGLGALPTAAQLALVRAATGPSEGIEDALREWRSLVDLSGPIDGGSYRLLPIVFFRLNAAEVEDPNRGMLKGVYRRSMVENTRVVHATTPALAALKAAGIIPWLAKGAGLVAAGYYPTLASRPMADVDVVVPSHHRDDAIDVLHSIGYVAQLSDREMQPRHAAAFVDPAGNELDLHWHQLYHVRSSEADEVITRHSESVEFNGVPVRVPGPTGLLIATAVHGMNPNREPPVRWLVDAALILERNGDAIAWDDIVEFANRFRLARRIERALGVLAETTGHAAPESTIAALASLPTSPTERLERGISTAPWDSIRGRILQILAGYAGGDRELKHVATGLPRWLSQTWNLEHVYQVPAAGVRKLRRRS